MYGKYDHLVPPEAAEVLPGKVGSKDVEDICLSTGHIGIYVSSKIQKLFVPKISAWLKEREAFDDKPPAPKKPRAPKKKRTPSAD